MRLIERLIKIQSLQLLVLGLQLPVLAFGQALVDASPYVGQKHLLPKAVQVSITPRGLSLFDKQLNLVLGNLGVNLSEGYFAGSEFSAEQPINLDELEKSKPEPVRIFKQIRQMMTEWLVGFSLNDHRPALRLGDSGYIANFNRFGMVTDDKLMQQLGRRDGAVLAIEMEIKKLTLATEKIELWDANNSILGKIGFEEFAIDADGDKVPLRVRLPFYVTLDPQGRVQFEALQINHNLESIPLALKYKNIIIPKMGVIVDGKQYDVDNAAIQKLLDEQTPLLLEEVKKYLGEFATKELPSILNQKAEEHINRQLEQVQNMEPPGKGLNDLQEDFKWGLQLASIQLNKSLDIQLSAYVEDGLNPKSTPNPKASSRGQSADSGLSPDQYDLFIRIDRGLLNRALQLSYERRYFEKMPQDDGSEYTLRAAPTLDYVKPLSGQPLKATEGFMKMRVALENKPSSMWLQNTIVVEFDLIVKVSENTKNGFKMAMHSIDLNSVYLDPKYMTWGGRLFSGKVLDAVKEELATSSKDWRKTENILADELPFTPEIFGIKSRPKKLVIDPQGHIVIYLEYVNAGGNK